MKKMYTTFLVIATILVSINTIGFSQTKVGIRGGLNLANVSEDFGGTESFDFEGLPLQITLSQTSRTTFNLGGFVEYWFSPMFALQINLLYNQKGFVIEGDLSETIIEQGIPISVTVNAEETIKLSYLSFPLLAKASFGESNFKPYIVAGPELSFLLSADDYAEATSEAEAQGIQVGPYTVNQEEDISEFIESFEFALDFGAGLSYSFGTIDVFADFIYSLGITKINTEDFADEDIKNQVIMINLGIMYTIK